MGVKLVSASGGSVEIVAPATASNYTATMPANSGTVITTASTFAGTGPAFSAYQSVAQTITTVTFTKVQLQAKEFDTASCFDASTNYRFTPNVAGYYQITGGTNLGGATGHLCSVYKNSSEYKRGYQVAGGAYQATVNALVYLNGSTDYVELYIYQSTGSSQNTTNTSYGTYFQGVLVRAA